MAKWRALADYSPFARLLVEYMWEQRPPLLPNQFAQRMGVRKQQVSSWLNSDATPAPPILVRLARGMARPVSELFIAAAYASADDLLLDTEEAWGHVLTEVQATPEFLALAEPQQIIVVGVLHAAHLRDREKHPRVPVEPELSESIDDDTEGDDTAGAGESPDESADEVINTQA
jgi:transcriptional regulator with XRE-family HTH domain